MCQSKLEGGSKEKEQETTKKIFPHSKEIEDHAEEEVVAVTMNESEDQSIQVPLLRTLSDDEENTSNYKGQCEYEKIRARNIKEREDILSLVIADVSDYKRNAGIGSIKLPRKRKKEECQSNIEEQKEVRKSVRLATKAKYLEIDWSQEVEEEADKTDNVYDELLEIGEARCNSDAKFEGNVKRVGSSGEFWAGKGKVLEDGEFKLDEWLLWQGPQRRQVVGEGALSASLRRLLSSCQGNESPCSPIPQACCLPQEVLLD